MRVITGIAKGRKLKTSKGLDVRPTSDRAKESLFNVLGSRVVESRILDLFAGSGAIGIEALSRGANRAVFVDSSPSSCRLVEENLRNTGLTANAEILRHDTSGALRSLAGKGEKFDLIFLDPPYQKGFVAPTLEQAAGAGLLSEHGLIVVEHSRREPVPASVGQFHVSRQLVFGDTLLSIYRRSENL